MSNEQPHIEFLSRNRNNRITVIGSIATIMAMGFIIFCLLPFHFWIGLGVSIFGGYVALFLIAASLLFLRKKYYEGHIIVANEQVFDVEQWKHLPALPPPRVAVSEVAEPDRSKEEADILELHSHGSSFKSIAGGYKDAGNSYWTEYRVRQLCNKHKYGSVID